ncbi:MAG TPA: pyridoxamine 5'-phosphate oxidase [Fimbriimonadaceae bacterium]|nr:pyridoxamine 5'-phosphate oxidase [Fimbriimonadaceae bacterium]HRJ95647.1 pyridoxamine 5'-phosphate oxidase [Fimbriimonadaceae bacterium]
MSDAFIGSREEYTLSGIDETSLDLNPISQLRAWLDDAETAGAMEPNAMCLATTDRRGAPSGRIVLLRSLDNRGLVFFTNYLSRKGRDLEESGLAAACFWWGRLQRQVRVEGRVERVAPEESDAYFASRPLESRYASAASPQSARIATREQLEAAVEHLRRQHPEGPPRPSDWGGYRLMPEVFEFWQGRPARLHDRFEYRLESGAWVIRRLAP